MIHALDKRSTEMWRSSEQFRADTRRRSHSFAEAGSSIEIRAYDGAVLDSFTAERVTQAEHKRLIAENEAARMALGIPKFTGKRGRPALGNDGRGKERVRVGVSLSPVEAQKLDKLRGSLSRAEYLRKCALG